MGFQPLFQVFSCFVAIYLLICCSKAEDSVPFITWSNHQYLKDIPSKPAGQIVDSDFLLSTFIPKIIENEQNQVVVVFSFNQLSIDDISKYGGAYVPNSNGGNMENFMHSYQNSASQVTMEMVEPVSLKAIEEKAVAPVIQYSEQWSSKVAQDQFNLLVVPLELTTDRASSFSKADAVIKKLMDKVLAMGMKFTAILTADHPNKMLASRTEDPIIQVGRHLLQTGEDENNETYSLVRFKSGSCHGLLFVASISVGIKNEQIQIPNKGSWDTSKSKCSETSAKFVMSKLSGKVMFSLTLNFSVSASGYYWTFSKSEAKITVNETEYVVDDPIKAFHTPRNFSFHCGTQILKNATDSVTVQLLHFQVQPFNVNDTDPKFGRANDCVGFFTPGIWMGLVTTLILVLILYFGVSMLASLTVMDQFDDPKGKTITVNVAE